MKQKTAGERIRELRGDMSQADFGQLLDSSQGAVSAWERDDKDRSPSAAVYFRLAALARDPEDTVFFLEQAGLQPDAVISVADALLKKGEVKMDAILATAEEKLRERMGDQKEMEEKGKVVLVPPFDKRPGPYEEDELIPVLAAKVRHKASTYYVEAPWSEFGAVGHGVGPGDIVVFDTSGVEPGDFDSLSGEVVALRIAPGENRPGGLFVGRVGFIAEGPKLRHLVLGPIDEPRHNWGLHRLHASEACYVKLGESHGTPTIGMHGAHSRSDWHPLSSCQILGRVVGTYPGPVPPSWKR
jgi:transcriptional regulator with XRE-family HTH domain